MSSMGLTLVALLLGAARAGARHGPWRLDENPTCWVDGYSYELCCREGAWHCFSGSADALHSWDRCCRSPCGSLTARVVAAAGAECSGKGPWNETVVSGLWDLKRQLWASHDRYKEEGERSYDKYLEWLGALLRKRQALLLFLDAEAAAFARKLRTGLGRLTCIVEAPMNELPQMRWREAYERAHAENARRLPGDTQPEVIHANYTLVVNSKPELLACAAAWNPFGSHTFAWVDAGVGRKSGFPKPGAPLVFPACGPWSLCVGRRMWLFWDFQSKVKRLSLGSTFDSTVLLGGAEGVMLYALWFQWAIAMYLAEGVMDDEQGVIAEVWWAGSFTIQSIYGMTWDETTVQMLQADRQSTEDEMISLTMARKMGAWTGDHPSLVRGNRDFIWVPAAENLQLVMKLKVRSIGDEHLERVAYALWCLNRQFGYYAKFCDRWGTQHHIVGMQDLPVISPGQKLIY